MNLETIDLVIIGLYAIAIISLAQWVSRPKPGHERDTKDYFLAGKSLPWWAIGASLIAANISAEQIIGMSGSGYAIGIAIASYEWMSAITLIIVGKYFLPIFLKHGIYTMPQFLEQRYDHNVRMVMAIFWIGVYVLVNLTAILWLGALAINSITGLPLSYGLLILGALAIVYSTYGGLRAVALTDIVQVVILVLGGLIIAYVTLTAISPTGGVISGFIELTKQAPEKFDLILSKDNPHYISLPGISVLVGGLWIMNLSYWGFNQYTIQRVLAAKNLKEAQKGIVFAAYLKLFMPVIVVLPGIAAVVLAPELVAPDQAYAEMMKLVPTGIRGLVFAALIAAILSSLGSMMNSISTIFTMDIYRSFRPGTSEKKLVTIGRTVAVLAIIIAMIVAKPLLGQFDQAFQYIQEFTGFFTPGIVVIFMLGLFWKRATAGGALAAAIGSAIFSFLFKIFYPLLPFIDRVGIVFLLCMALAIIVSLLTSKGAHKNAIPLDEIDFKTSKGFLVATIGILVVLTGLYTAWW
ncbi:MAG: sodium/sugar symporter [Robiginitomaculum sp.]|nr:sodium/sugar symporter [Robiginitomaculum sp.]